MKEHPILFSTNMVQAILEGRKTQTRRVLKLQPDNECYFEMKLEKGYLTIDYNQGDKNPTIKCPYGEVGDVLWVRETFAEWGIRGGYAYKADGFISRDGAWERDTPKKFHDVERIEKWKPSIFMPRAACRITLEITNIRVERLQDISEGDAITEGVKENICEMPNDCPSSLCANGCTGKGEYYRYESPMDFEAEPCYSAIESYKSLWQSINGKESWDANPWVWVVEFKKIK